MAALPATPFARRTIAAIPALGTIATIAALTAFTTRRPIARRRQCCLIPTGQRCGRFGNQRLRDGLVICLRRPRLALTRLARRTRLTLRSWFAWFA